MNILQISMTKIGKYLRELSVVVAGIFITVGIGLWVNSINVKKDQKQYLDAIILELKENAENFDNYAKLLQKSVRYSNYLNSNDEKSYNLDSIQFYAFSGSDGIGWGNWTPVILYSENAFEMFKSSGDMRHVSDKDLLLSVWHVYYYMKQTQHIIDDMLQYKKEVSMNESRNEVVRVKRFYINDVPQYMKDNCEATAEFIRETVSELEKSKIVK